MFVAGGNGNLSALVRSPIAWLLAAGIALRFGVAAFHELTPISDFALYHLIATTVAEYGNYGSAPGSHEAFFPPGWPVSLGVAYRLFGNDPTVGALLAALFSSGTCVIAAILATRLLRPFFAAGAVAVIALNPAWIFFSSVLATEHLAGFLATSVIALLVLRPLDWKTGFGIGLLEGALLLTRADVGFVVFAAIALTWVAKGPRRHMRFAGLAVAGVVLALTPWTIRNAVRFGEFLPTSANGGIVFYRGTFEENDALEPDPEPPPAVGLTESPRGYDAYYWRLGMRYVAEDPIAFLGYVAARLETQYWYDNELLFWADIHFPPPDGTKLAAFVDWLWRGLLALALLGAAAALTGRIDRKRWLPIVAMVLGLTIMTPIFVGFPRRHYPAIAGFTLLAAGGAQYLRDTQLRRGTTQDQPEG